jgi:hypothetical protein
MVTVLVIGGRTRILQGHPELLEAEE